MCEQPRADSRPSLFLAPRRVVVLLAATWVLAVEGVPAQEATPWPALFQDETEVHVLNVEVYVTGGDGRPVPGLEAGDFELLEDGEAVEIEHFYAVQGGRVLAGEGGFEAPPAASTRPATPDGADRLLHLLIFVDNANLQPAHRQRVLARVRDFLVAGAPSGGWRRDLRAMVMSNNGSLVVHGGFTAELDNLLHALDEAAAHGGPAPRFDQDLARLLDTFEQDINVEAGSGLFATKDPLAGAGLPADDDPSVRDTAALRSSTANQAAALLPLIDAYAQERVAHARRTLAVLRQAVDAAAGLPGRRALLYVSDGLPLKPGEALYEAFSRRFERLGGVGAEVSGLLASRDELTADFDDLLDHANAAGVTFYPLHAAIFAGSSRGAAGGARSAGGNFGHWDDSLAATESRNLGEPLVLLAGGTGGRAGLSGAAWDGVLEGVVEDFDNYYSLGYPVEPRGEGDRRRIEVRLKDGRRAALRYRASYRVKGRGEQMAETVMAALLGDAGENPLGVALEAQATHPAENGQYVVPVLAEVPLGRLLLLPGQTAHQARISLYVAVRDEHGRVSDVAHHQCPIRIDNSEVLLALGRTMGCGVRLLMRGGHQWVAVAVRDEIAGAVATARIELDVPYPPELADDDPSPMPGGGA